jgi:hypothetical protein
MMLEPSVVDDIRKAQGGFAAGAIASAVDAK